MKYQPLRDLLGRRNYAKWIQIDLMELTWSQEKENYKSNSTHDYTRYNKAETPVVLDKNSSNDCAENITRVRVRVPETKDYTTGGLAEPVADA